MGEPQRRMSGRCFRRGLQTPVSRLCAAWILAHLSLQCTGENRNFQNPGGGAGSAGASSDEAGAGAGGSERASGGAPNEGGAGGSSGTPNVSGDPGATPGGGGDPPNAGGEANAPAEGGAGGEVGGAEPTCTGEEDFTADPRNCGRCGNDCGAAACKASLCEAESIYAAPKISGFAAGGGALVYHDTSQAFVVAEGNAEPIITASTAATLASLATDGKFVYWAADGTLSRSPIAGGNATPLADDAGLPLIQGDQLFYRSGTRTIRRVKGSNNTGSTNVVDLTIGLTISDSPPFSVDGTLVSYSVAGQGLFARDGSTSNEVREPSGILYDAEAFGGRVYFLTGTGVGSVTLANKTPVTRGTFTYGSGFLAVDASGIYALVFSYGAQGSCSSVNLYHLPIAGGDEVKRWTLPSSCGSGLALDGDHVYFSAYPRASATSTSPLAQPTLFRMTK